MTKKIKGQDWSEDVWDALWLVIEAARGMLEESDEFWRAAGVPEPNETKDSSIAKLRQSLAALDKERR